jgi:cellulose synthase (UDP-forming)
LRFAYLLLDLVNPWRFPLFGFKRQQNYREKRRGLGRDRRKPLPPVASPTSLLAVGRGRAAIGITVVAWAAYVVPLLWDEITRPEGWSPGSFAETATYVLTTTLLAFSALAYLFARHGALERIRRHSRTPRGIIDQAMREQPDRSITILVPAYREDARVVRQTLISAALQEYPHKRIVLLIDDPPVPDSAANARLLEAARNLPGEIAQILAEPAGKFTAALATFDADPSGDADAIASCAVLYHEAASWLERFRQGFLVADHSDRFCRDTVMGTLERDFAEAGVALQMAAEKGDSMPETTVRQMYQRLAWTFCCEFTSFERKQYVNLSHEANKAMNLNSYLGLMGGSHREVGKGQNLALASCAQEDADLVVPETDYILTLDADSVLLPEYCLRLTYRLEQPAFADVALIQTPYSSFPGAGSRLERIAGATTDIQHMLHQGMTYYGATFWVGANAILRYEALNDIVQVDTSDMWPIRRYISDRTVIEDTESSIDLLNANWRLHNYQERLSYSATPHDFGSLAIQRERWANGGLLILGKLLRSVRRGADPVGVMLRINYMASIAWASIGLLLLLVYPFDDRLLSPLVVVVAAPYFMAMAADLKRNGYRRSDVVRIYAFNLLMLPVNLSGSMKSIIQAATGRKQAFARTPKIKTRTTAPFWFVAFPYLLVAWSSVTTYRDIQNEAWAHAVFAGLNAVLGLYGLVAFIGIKNSMVDMSIRAFEMLRSDRQGDGDGEDDGEHWEEVLFYGNEGSSETIRGRMPVGLAVAAPEAFTPLEEQGVREIRSVETSKPLVHAGVGAADDELVEAVRTSRVLLEAIERRLTLESAERSTGGRS